ncbi:MAG: hypothetical protein R6W99_04235, partial [Clostridia bacterium]
FMAGVVDVIRNEVSVELEKKLAALELVPKERLRLMSLEEIRDKNKKFPFYVIDHGSDNLDKYQIRKFNSFFQAEYSVLIGDKKIKADTELDIYEERYMPADENAT